MNEASRHGNAWLAGRLKNGVEGEVLFDAFTRGRYATDASLYQIEPLGVVLPKSVADIERVLQVAREESVPVLPRGAGTSQCGQTVGAAVVVDVSRHLNRVLDFDATARTARVEPGIVLDRLNAYLKPHGLWFPVDVSTASRATIGGMTGNNSCGSRSLRYGTMRDNVSAVDALLIDGTPMRFATLPEDMSGWPDEDRAFVQRLLAIGEREAAEAALRFPAVMRRVGGYNIDALIQDNGTTLSGRLAKLPRPNLAHLLIGSEGTLAFSTAIDLKLSPLPKHKVVGICHFPKFYAAMDAAQHIVKLGPSAVEVVDRTLIELARDIPLFRPTIERAVRGAPDALLLVEFAGEDEAEQLRSLKRLGELMGDLGYPDSVVEAIPAEFQKALWDVRSSGLNIMMSMRGDGKPVSFIEDCAVSLEHLAEYTDRLTQVFRKHGTTGTWYAHASVGCLHVRPILNMKSGTDVKKMRAIAEEAFAMVREYKGSHSGEHGDGLVRSEFNEIMFGGRLVRAFEDVKDIFDPRALLNPGKIVRPSRMDDRALFRYRPEYKVEPLSTALDWSAWGGFGGAIEMCNNNGECRKFSAGAMCPSFRATGDEQHLTRGRANTLRLAVSGQLGDDALTSDAMADTMRLCISCKACKRECPTGVDMARMKIEVLHHYKKRHGISLRDHLIAHLPRYAPHAAMFAPLLNLRDQVPGLARISEHFLGFSAKRKLPRWRRDRFRPRAQPSTLAGAREVVLWADTFNSYFEPENLRAAVTVLEAAGSCVHVAEPKDGSRPLCCGRTYLAAGMVDEARAEARRTLDALLPFAARGLAVIGLEPSCLFTFKDEFAALLPGKETDTLAAHAMMFEDFLAKEAQAGRMPSLYGQGGSKLLVHGHCHQKAFAAMGPVEKVLRLIPGADVEVIDSTCCGMAGAFGYQAETFDVSLKIGELGVLPKARAASPETVLVADGTSCRHQIREATGRDAVHVARVLARALAKAP